MAAAGCREFRYATVGLVVVAVAWWLVYSSADSQRVRENVIALGLALFAVVLVVASFAAVSGATHGLVTALNR